MGKTPGLEETTGIIHTHICHAFRKGTKFPKRGQEIAGSIQECLRAIEDLGNRARDYKIKEARNLLNGLQRIIPDYLETAERYEFRDDYWEVVKETFDKIGDYQEKLSQIVELEEDDPPF